MTEDLNQEMPPTPKPRMFNELSVLFPLLSLYTIAYLAATAAKFFLGDSLVLPDEMMPIYMALLGAYATDKEVRRWMGRPEPPRKGTIFVYFWFLLFLVFVVIKAFHPVYEIPGHTVKVCLQVLGVFFGTNTSKHIHAGRASRMELLSSRQAKVLEIIKTSGSITRAMVEDEFKLSSASARRLLAEMEKAGLIEKQGQARDTSYILSKTAPQA